MFQYPEILQLIAEVAVTVTGFTAIAAAFGRSQGDWNASEKILFQVLIRTSVIVLFFSFLPWLLGQLLNSSDLVWRTSCGLYAIVQLADVAWFLKNVKAKPTRGQSILAALGFVNVACQVASAMGFLAPFQLVFVAGLIFLMYVSIHNFVLLLVIGLEQPD